MCVFENRQQDVKVTLAGAGDRRIITGSEIGFEGKKIWVALLEAPQIWHTRELKPADTGKVIPLDWKMPFPAQWRVDFTRSNDLTDSWEMLLQEQKDGKYIKPSWLGGGEEQIDPRPEALEHGAGHVSLPVLVRPRPAGLPAAAQEQACCNSEGRWSSIRSTASSKRRWMPTRWWT